MVAGRSGIGPIRQFDASKLASPFAAEVKGFEDEPNFDKKGARRLGLFQQFTVHAGDEAMADAGFVRDGGPWPEAERFGVYVASGIGGVTEIVDQALLVPTQGVNQVPPTFIPRALVNLAGGALAIRYTAKGPSICISTACAAGNHSIGEAARSIILDDTDVIIAGGAEASFASVGYGGFMNMRALSRWQGEPRLASRPFDLERDGFVMGEGCGLVVLEELEHAKRRGARIYAELVGYGATTDAFHVTAPSPGGEGAQRCMRMALRSGKLDPKDVDYINAHGTSTPLNDKTETEAIKGVFGDHAYKLAVSSTKSVTGHLLGAAGGLEAVATVMALHTGIVPPTANLHNPDPECDLDYVPNEARKSHPKVAISNGFGFGGTNAVLAFRAWEG